MDLAGNVCNIHYEGSEDMSDFPVLYYTNMYSIGVCVSECPAVEAGIDAGGASIGVSGFYPGETEGLTAITVADYSEQTGFSLCDVTAEAGVTNPCDWRKAMVEVAAETDGYMVRGGDAGLGYGFPVLDTYRFMNRCILTSNAAIQLEASFNAAMQTSDEDSGFLEKLQSDLYSAQGWILGFGFVVAMFVRDRPPPHSLAPPFSLTPSPPHPGVLLLHVLPAPPRRPLHHDLGLHRRRLRHVLRHRRLRALHPRPVDGD
jgi:hypothetical protein